MRTMPCAFLSPTHKGISHSTRRPLYRPLWGLLHSPQCQTDLQLADTVKHTQLTGWLAGARCAWVHAAAQLLEQAQWCNHQARLPWCAHAMTTALSPTKPMVRRWLLTWHLVPCG